MREGIDILIAIIIIVLLVVFLSLVGCHNSSPELNLREPPPPAKQLWNAAKRANWLVTVSIVGIAIGVFATMNGCKWGIAGIMSCCVSLFMALAVARFATWMAVCGLLGSTGLCVASILVRKKALVEIIKGIQKYKNDPISDGSDEILNSYLSVTQSKPTERIVKQIKEKIK